MPRIPQSIQNPHQILNTRRGSLHRLYTHTQELLRVEQKIAHLMPANVHVAALDNEVLHLVTPTPALATRVRYQSRKIIAVLGLPLKTVKVSVRPEAPATAERRRPPLPMSAENARHLADTAKYIEDKGLREALIRLSNRAFDG
ncbi:MAG: hypothetical protein ACFHX7_20490 [Pseudomonadota bacterium]